MIFYISMRFGSRKLAEIPTITIIAVARFKSNRFVLRLSKLGKQRIQATITLTGATRISRHGEK